jgi:hypothetical protein
MQFKSITAIAVLSLLVVSLSVAGCTTSPTNQTPTSSTATHDAFLENLLAAFKNRIDLDKNYSTKAWDVKWINGTSARLEYTARQNATLTEHTLNMVMIFTAFPTSQDATNYLNAMNKTSYSLASNICTGGASGGAYQDITGHAPQICKDYKRSEGNSSSYSEYKEYHIFQIDNVILEATIKYLD